MKRVVIIFAIILLVLLVLMAGIREGCSLIRNRQLTQGQLIIPLKVTATTGAPYTRSHHFDGTYYPRTEYYFHGDFRFTVTEKFVYEGILWKKVCVTDYFSQLENYKIDELKTVLRKYRLDKGMYADEVTLQEEALKYGCVYTVECQELPDDGMPFYRYTFYVTNPEREEDIRACAQEMYNTLKDYFIKDPMDGMQYDWIVDMGYVTKSADGTISTEYKSIAILPMYS